MHNFKGASEEHINDYEYYYDDDDGDVASERNFPTFTQGGSFADVPQNIQDSLRRLLCPLCVARRFAFNTLSVRRHFTLLFHSNFLTNSVIFFAGDIRLHILESHAVHLGCELGVGRAGRIGGEEEGTALRCYYANS